MVIGKGTKTNKCMETNLLIDHNLTKCLREDLLNLTPIYNKLEVLNIIRSAIEHNVSEINEKNVLKVFVLKRSEKPHRCHIYLNYGEEEELYLFPIDIINFVMTH